MTGLFRFLTLFVVAGFPIASEAAAPDPSDPAAVVPAVAPASALASYRKAPEEARAGWAEAHRDLTGADASESHADHAGHGAEPAAEDTKASGSDPHAGHRMDQ